MKKAKVTNLVELVPKTIYHAMSKRNITPEEVDYAIDHFLWDYEVKLLHAIYLADFKDPIISSMIDEEKYQKLMHIFDMIELLVMRARKGMVLERHYFSCAEINYEYGLRGKINEIKKIDYDKRFFNQINQKKVSENFAQLLNSKNKPVKKKTNSPNLKVSLETASFLKGLMNENSIPYFMDQMLCKASKEEESYILSAKRWLKLPTDSFGLLSSGKDMLKEEKCVVKGLQIIFQKMPEWMKERTFGNSYKGRPASFVQRVLSKQDWDRKKFTDRVEQMSGVEKRTEVSPFDDYFKHFGMDEKNYYDCLSFIQRYILALKTGAYDGEHYSCEYISEVFSIPSSIVQTIYNGFLVVLAGRMHKTYEQLVHLEAASASSLVKKTK